MGGPADGAAWRLALTGAALLSLIACGGEERQTGARQLAPTVDTTAREVDSLVLESDEEVRAELEVLGYEIADIEALIESGAARVPSGGDPREALAMARQAGEAAERHLARGERELAIDSLEVAAGHVERVKRALGLAEEWGEPLPPHATP